MDKSKITETKNHITYKVNTRFHRKDYDIAKSRLNEICNYKEGFKNISEWVAHLSEKTWASKRMILIMCDYIKQIHPKNEINWDETYRYIDSINYETK